MIITTRSTETIIAELGRAAIEQGAAIQIAAQCLGVLDSATADDRSAAVEGAKRSLADAQDKHSRMMQLVNELAGVIEWKPSDADETSL